MSYDGFYVPPPWLVPPNHGRELGEVYDGDRDRISMYYFHVTVKGTVLYAYSCILHTVNSPRLNGMLRPIFIHETSMGSCATYFEK